MRTRLWTYLQDFNPKQQHFIIKTQKPSKPSDSLDLENYLTATQIELANISEKQSLRIKSNLNLVRGAISNIKKNTTIRSKVRNNLSTHLRRALKSLKGNTDLVIKKADKGQSTVVIDKQGYIQEGHRQLQSSSHYCPIDTNLTDETATKVHTALLDMLEKGEISDSNLSYLDPLFNEQLRTPEMYLLNKIHSNPPTKSRPIIACNSSPVERIAEFLDFFLVPIVQKQDTYLKDTSDFIRKLEQVQIPNNALIITLDYCSMYTNVPHDEALSALRYTLNNNTQHQYVKGVKRPSTDSLCHLAQIILENNTFVFNGQNWKQSLGVAMGVKVSPELCDLTIFRMEKEFLKQCTTDMFLWKRYRDDVFAIWTGSIDAAHQFLNYANSLHKTLKFEYCISPDGANFLDTTIFKGTRFALEGLLDFKPYTKPTETFQYLHRTSAHPPSVFTGLIKGELIRFVRTSTNKCDYLVTCGFV